MRVAVVGAQGRTGAAVVDEALRRDHEVIAIARRPNPSNSHASVEWRPADVTDSAAIAAAITGADAVVCAVGIGSSKEETIAYSAGVRNLIDALAASGAGRLVVVSASPAGPPEHHNGFQRAVVLPILEKFFGASYRDMRRMEAELAGSEVNWVSLRPPRLLEKKPRGSYETGVLPTKGGAITIADLATALVDFAEADNPRGPVYVAN